MEKKYLLMHILDVHTAAPFKDLFTIKPSVLADITDSMKKNGYDEAFPLILWAGHGGVLVDGHTRLQAAKDAGVLDVAVVMHDFADELGPWNTPSPVRAIAEISRTGKCSPASRHWMNGKKSDVPKKLLQMK